MKINANQLTAHCNAQRFCPLYWIAGDEPYLATQAQKQLTASLEQAGFSETIKLSIDNTGFKTDDLVEHCSNLSLFSTKQRIEINISDKVPETLIKTLQSWLESNDSDTIIVIQSKRLSAAQQKTKWFTTLDKKMGFIPIWPIESNQLPGFLQHEARARKLHLNPDAAQYLANSTEGNLLAAAQALDKLAYTTDTQKIDLETLKQHVDNQARFDVYAFTDAFLLHQTEKALRILNTLTAEQVEPTVIIWALAREVRLLAELHQAKNTTPLPQLFKQKGIWQKRQQIIQTALRQYTYHNCLDYLVKLAELDKVSKGLRPGDTWEALIELIYTN